MWSAFSFIKAVFPLLTGPKTRYFVLDYNAVSNNDARVMKEVIFRFCRKRMADFKGPKTLHSYLHYLKVLKVKS